MGTVVQTGGLQGVEGVPVRVEVDLVRGLPSFHLVGLPTTAVRESRERVLAAIRNSGFRLPAGKVTVNLAPADVRKEGTGHDLAIAVAVVTAQRLRRGGQPQTRGGFLLGELSLFGEVRPVRGLLPIVLDARERGERTVVVPAAQASEARLVPDVEVVGVSTLTDAVAWYLEGRPPPLPVIADVPAATPQSVAVEQLASQPLAARAALLAAAGRHHLLLVGPPGAGKTRLARILAHLLPDLTADEGLEVTRIHSAAGLFTGGRLLRRPPFRAPHHTITVAGLLGGGAWLRPGEATLAHRGLLFLDEVTEFSAGTLDALREPLTDGVVRLARAGGQRRFPSRFQLVAAANPCRCGYHGSRERACQCSRLNLARYRNRLSGPLRDRMDLVVDMPEAPATPLTSPGEPSPQLADWRVQATRARRLLDGASEPPPTWSVARRVRGYGLSVAACRVLEAARQPLGLSVRGVLRACCVARTVAALAGQTRVDPAHVQEALQYRHEALGSWDAAEGLA